MLQHRGKKLSMSIAQSAPITGWFQTRFFRLFCRPILEVIKNPPLNLLSIVCLSNKQGYSSQNFFLDQMLSITYSGSGTYAFVSGVSLSSPTVNSQSSSFLMCALHLERSRMSSSTSVGRRFQPFSIRILFYFTYANPVMILLSSMFSILSLTGMKSSLHKTDTIQESLTVELGSSHNMHLYIVHETIAYLQLRFSSNTYLLL